MTYGCHQLSIIIIIIIIRPLLLLPSAENGPSRQSVWRAAMEERRQNLRDSPAFFNSPFQRIVVYKVHPIFHIPYYSASLTLGVVQHT